MLTFAKNFATKNFEVMNNPFKFGTLVDGPYFTDRQNELKFILQYLDSDNHLILISPRRFGKSSLIKIAVKQTGRPCISINLQQITSIEDFAAMIIKGVYRLYPWQKVKHLLANFRFVPTISTSPMGDSLQISFNPTLMNTSVLLEDAISLLYKVNSEKDRLIVVLDEFPELLEIEPHIDKRLRAILQEQSGINYIFLGSQESMMTDIFEKVKSPFYHFGTTMHLSAIPHQDFLTFIIERLAPIDNNNAVLIAEQILAFTKCHPYYTQQLASQCWEMLALHEGGPDIVVKAIDRLVQSHDLDYERLWLTFPLKTRKVMMTLAEKNTANTLPAMPYSTYYSIIKKLLKEGYIIRSEGYDIEDPFFKEWIFRESNQ